MTMANPQLSIATAPVAGVLTQPVFDPEAASLLERVRARAAEQGLDYAGDVTPQEAHELLSSGAARLVDVRTPEERKFVGFVPDSIAVAWATGTAFTRNPRFVRELEGKARKDEVLLFVCRSGSRSVQAAQAAARAGFQQAFNVVEGFEGELDARQHRGMITGWRFHGLPWVQD
jgi:rhodanese-related sulfurtransferase